MNIFQQQLNEDLKVKLKNISIRSSRSRIQVSSIKPDHAIRGMAQRIPLMGDTYYLDADGSARLSILSTNAFYSVKTFGARGDGTTDDTAAIMATIAAACATGGPRHVVFPRGTYLCTQLNIVYTDLILEGFGYAKLRFKDGEAGSFINITGYNDLIVRGFDIDGGNRDGIAIGSNGSRIGIKSYGEAYNTVVRDCWIQGFDEAGIFVGTTGYTLFHGGGALIQGCVFAFNYKGIELAQRGEYSLINHCQVCRGSIGVEVVGGNNIICNCGFNDNIDGIRVLSGSNDSHGSFTGCTSNHNSGNALYVDGITNGHIFNGCEFYSANIYLKNATGVRIFNCDLGGYSTQAYFEGGGINIIKDCLVTGTWSAVNRNYNGSTDHVQLYDNFDLTGAYPAAWNDAAYGKSEDVAVAKVGGGTRTMHFTRGKYTGYTDS